MTLSVLGVCARTGKFGFATASATPMCGWRSAGVARGLGVYVVQGEEDPRQLSIIARMLAAGLSPAKILHELSESDEHFERRQIALLAPHVERTLNPASNAALRGFPAWPD